MSEKTSERPLDCKEIKPVNYKGNQSWIFIGRTDAEAEAPILRSPDAKSRLVRKDSDAGKYWRQEKGITEDEMVGWRHWLNGHEFEQAQRWWRTRKAWGCKDSDTAEQLNINKCPMQCLRHAYPQVLLVYLKFKFHLASYILSNNSIQETHDS